MKLPKLVVNYYLSFTDFCFIKIMADGILNRVGGLVLAVSKKGVNPMMFFVLNGWKSNR